MSEAQRDCVEPLAVELKLLGKDGIGPIECISHERMALGLEMHANLVGSSGFQMHFYQCGTGENFQGVVVGNRVSALAHHRELPRRTGVATNGRVDGARGGRGVALERA